VQGHLRENGGLRVVNALAERFVADGVRTSLFALEDVGCSEPVALPGPGVRLHLGASADLPAARRLPTALARLLRVARDHDVVVSGSEIGHGLLAASLTARALGKPFVVLAQGDLDAALEAWVPPKLRAPTRWVHRHADAAVAVSPGLVPGLVANGIPADRVHVVVNGVDVDALTERATEPSPVALDPDRPTVLAVGRLTGHKGFDLLLRASARVRGAGHDHELVVLGEGPDRPALEALRTELGADHVRLPGFVDNPAALLARADLLVSSSRTEAMPLTLLEALALAVPVVATDCCEGSRLLLDDGRHGALVAPESVDALADALTAHLTDQRPLRHAAAGGPSFARGFEPRRLARRHLELLSAVAHRPLPAFAPLPVGTVDPRTRTGRGPSLGTNA
jgi:glycosyltransferase involved in cell wall biosynthesis